MATHISPDNTLSMLEQAPQRQNSVLDKPINRLAEAIAGIASQQQSQTLKALFEKTTPKRLIFGGKNEKVELFGDLLQTMLQLQLEKSEVMKNKNFHSHLRKEALQTFKTINASNK